MFEQFSDRARQAVVQAQQEARRLDHNYIGTEHLLLGLIREGDGVAAKALESLGISLDAVRQQVEEIIGRGQQTLSGHFPFTPRAKRVLELSLREALQLGHKYIGTEHILLGLIREGDGVAAQVLVRLGCDLNRVRQEVIRLLTGHQGKDSKIAGSGPGERARAGLPEDFYPRIGALDRRLAAVERWTGMRPDLGDLDQEIAQVRREKGSRARPAGFRHQCRPGRKGEATAGRAGRPGAGVGGVRRWPQVAGQGIGPAKRRTGEAAGDSARTRHRARRRRRIGAHAEEL